LAEAAQQERLAAADWSMDVFAREAMLALYDFEKTFPPREDESARRVGTRFAYLWNRYGLDGVSFAPNSSVAQRSLAAAAELATAPDSPGLKLADAWHKATADAGGPVRPLPEHIERARREMHQWFGKSQANSTPGDWLDQSLSRLARASVLRDVIRLGAEVEVSQPGQEAAAEFIRQGQRMMDTSREVSTAASNLQDGYREYFLMQLRNAGAYFAYGLSLDLTDWPNAAQFALEFPAAMYYAHKSLPPFLDRVHLQLTVRKSQQELRTGRQDVIGLLDQPSSVDQRAVEGGRAVDRARRRDGGDRGR
jgi:hypothetical protein